MSDDGHALQPLPQGDVRAPGADHFAERSLAALDGPGRASELRQADDAAAGTGESRWSSIEAALVVAVTRGGGLAQACSWADEELLCLLEVDDTWATFYWSQVPQDWPRYEEGWEHHLRPREHSRLLESFRDTDELAQACVRVMRAAGADPNTIDVFDRAEPTPERYKNAVGLEVYLRAGFAPAVETYERDPKEWEFASGVEWTIHVTEPGLMLMIGDDEADRGDPRGGTVGWAQLAWPDGKEPEFATRLVQLGWEVDWHLAGSGVTTSLPIDAFCWQVEHTLAAVDELRGLAFARDARKPYLITPVWIGKR